MIRQHIKRALQTLRSNRISDEEMSKRIKKGNEGFLTFQLTRRTFDRPAFIVRQSRIFFRRAATMTYKEMLPKDITRQKLIVDAIDKLYRRKQELYEEHGLGAPKELLETDQIMREQYAILEKAVGGGTKLHLFFQNLEKAMQKINKGQ